MLFLLIFSCHDKNHHDSATLQEITDACLDRPIQINCKHDPVAAGSPVSSEGRSDKPESMDSFRLSETQWCDWCTSQAPPPSAFQ